MTPFDEEFADYRAELSIEGTLRADTFLSEAIEMIDATFGDGYARANPVLVTAYMQSSATACQAIQARLAHQENPIAQAIRSAARSLGLNDASTPMGTIEAHARLTAEVYDRIASALNEIAERMPT